MSQTDEYGRPGDEIDAAGRGVREALLTRVGVSSADAWEYDPDAAGSGPVAWAQSHVALAIAGAALAWFAGVFVISLVVGVFV